MEIEIIFFIEINANHDVAIGRGRRDVIYNHQLGATI